MSDLRVEQNEMMNAALTWLLSRPGSGRRDIPGHVLRQAFRAQGLDHGNRVIDACVPVLLQRGDAEGKTYYLTLEGLLRASDERPRQVLGTALGLIAERYHAGDLDQRNVLWSDIRSKGSFDSEDFEVAWHSILTANVSGGGGRIASNIANVRSTEHDYDFWLKEGDLETIAYNSTVDAWLKVQTRESEPRVRVTSVDGAAARLVGIHNSEIVFAREGISVVRDGLLDASKALASLREEAKVLLGRELDPLVRHVDGVQRMYELFHSAQHDDDIRVGRTEDSLRFLRMVHHWIAARVGTRSTRNAIRVRLGASEMELISEVPPRERVSADLDAVLGGPLKPRTLTEWIGAESSPRFELLRKACVHFVQSGSGLKLSGERRTWKERDLDADVDREAAALAHYCLINGDRVIPRLEAFVLFPECAVYIEGVLSIVRHGIARFLQGAVLEPSERPRVNADDMANIVGSLPFESFRRFVEHLSILDGVCDWSPFSWMPSRRLLRFYPAKDVGDLVAAAGLLGTTKHALPEESLEVLRVVADVWMKTRTWPTLDALVVDERLGPQYAYALTDLNFTWIRSPDHRSAILDLDGLILGASEGLSLANTVARVIGMLADELDEERGASLAEVARLTGVEIELLRHLLPLLQRSDLGLSVLGESTPNMEVRAGRALADYIRVRSVVEFSARWSRNRDQHPEYGRAEDADRLNVFAAATVQDRIRALGARDRRLMNPEGLEDSQDRVRGAPAAAVSDLVPTGSNASIAHAPREVVERNGVNETATTGAHRQPLDEVVHLLERFSVAALTQSPPRRRGYASECRRRALAKAQIPAVYTYHIAESSQADKLRPDGKHHRAKSQP